MVTRKIGSKKPKSTRSRRSAIPAALASKQHKITFSTETFSPYTTERLRKLVQPAAVVNLGPGEVTATLASGMLEIRAALAKLLKEDTDGDNIPF